MLCLLMGLLASCSLLLKKPSVKKYAPLEAYKYVLIGNEKSVMRGYDYAYSQRDDLQEILQGELMKRGFIILQEFRPELSSRTLLVNYAVSNKRDLSPSDYAIEVTLQFVSASSHNLVAVATAEGLDDIMTGELPLN